MSKKHTSNESRERSRAACGDSAGAERTTCGERSRTTRQAARRGSGRKSTRPRASLPPVVTTVEPPLVSRVEPRTHRELATAIFAECNAVGVGRELLESAGERGAAVRARMFETLANWQFGNPGPRTGGGNVRVIWDVPCPPHEPSDPE